MKGAGLIEGSASGVDCGAAHMNMDVGARKTVQDRTAVGSCCRGANAAEPLPVLGPWGGLNPTAAPTLLCCADGEWRETVRRWRGCRCLVLCD